MRGLKFCSFDYATNMSERLSLGWREDVPCLKSCFQAWFFEKGVLETLISCLRFLHIYSCVVLVGVGDTQTQQQLEVRLQALSFSF